MMCLSCDSEPNITTDEIGYWDDEIQYWDDEIGDRGDENEDWDNDVLSDNELDDTSNSEMKDEDKVNDALAVESDITNERVLAFVNGLLALCDRNEEVEEESVEFLRNFRADIIQAVEKPTN